MKYRKEADGYKCAACGEYHGEWIPDDGCPRCGCITAEVKYEYIPIEEENVRI
jgi:rubrerythrin